MWRAISDPLQTILDNVQEHLLCFYGAEDDPNHVLTALGACKGVYDHRGVHHRGAHSPAKETLPGVLPI